jgi:hypothetical protein
MGEGGWYPVAVKEAELRRIQKICNLRESPIAKFDPFQIVVMTLTACLEETLVSV